MLPYRTQLKQRWLTWVGEGALLSCQAAALTLLILVLGAGMQNKPHTDPDCPSVFGSAGTFSLQTVIILVV